MAKPEPLSYGQQIALPKTDYLLVSAVVADYNHVGGMGASGAPLERRVEVVDVSLLSRGQQTLVESRPSMIFVTQLLDRNDSVLSFVIALIVKLSGRLNRLVVIANEVRGNLDLPIEVVSLGKEDGATRQERAIRYETTIASLAKSRQFDALLAHMCPTYINMAAPLAKLFRLSLMLWFVHPARSINLALAERMADVVLTSFVGAYPRDTSKLHVIGHAIDLDTLPLLPQPHIHDSLELLCLGRTSPYKGYPTIIRAVAQAQKSRVSVRLRIVGSATTLEEIAHRADLKRLIEELGMTDYVSLEEGVPRSHISALLSTADGLVSTTASGGSDKTVLEAMAAGRPVLVSNPVFAPLLEPLPPWLRFEQDSVEQLADRIQVLANLEPSVRSELAGRLRHQVSGHSLDHWVASVVNLVNAHSRSA